jgi:glycosyltransferase involved in cell wall biosynthesis
MILTESPPLFLCIAGYLLSRIKRALWVLNVSDLWPESAVRLGMVNEGPALQVSRWLEAFSYRHAWLVTGQSKEILGDILSRFPKTPVYHLSNGTDTSLFCPDVRSSYLRDRLGRGAIGLFAGLHGLAQGLDQVLCAAAMMDGGADLNIAFVGDGPLKPDLVKEAQRLGLQNVFFIDPLPHREIPAVLASADFCIVPLGLVLPGAVPSKLYEAMSIGRPVLLMAHGEAAEIVQNHECGLVVEPGDTKGLREAMQILTEDAGLRARLGNNGRQAALDHFDRRMIVEQFADFIAQAGA